MALGLLSLSKQLWHISQESTCPICGIATQKAWQKKGMLERKQSSEMDKKGV